MGGSEVNPAGAVVLPGGSANDRDPGIRTICEGKLLPLQELGDLTLKGFDHPVRAHAVSWAEAMFA